MIARSDRTDYVSLSPRPSGILLRFEPPYSITLGLAARAKEARRRVRRVLKQTAVLDFRSDGDAIEARFANERDANLAAAEMRKRLAAYLAEKLSPDLVEELLDITSRERVRWTKDGRLPTSGTVQFKKGRQTFQVFQYPVEGIGRLLENPGAVAEWRAQDAASAPREA
jgi:hypothetical protein